MTFVNVHLAARSLVAGGDFVLTVQAIEFAPTDVKVQWSIFVPGARPEADLYFRDGDPGQMLSALASALASAALARARLGATDELEAVGVPSAEVLP